MIAAMKERGSDMTKWYALLSLVLFADPASAVQGPGEDPRPASTIAAAPSFSPVTSERLRNADAEPHNWLMYSGNYSSQRYSGLDQVHIQNVDQLQMQWVHQLRVLDRSETTPLVVDGVMYVTEAPATVIALDARTGTRYWRYEHEMPEDLNYCCGRNNRGVAVLGNRVFMSTLDAHLVALDARTGNLLWDAEVADEMAGYSKTAAPLVVGDKVITGIAGGEFGIRGFVDAYDAKTGERAWRLYTIPGPGEPGNETGAGDSWRTGGAAAWMTGSDDRELNLGCWGKGKPGPEGEGGRRRREKGREGEGGGERKKRRGKGREGKRRGGKERKKRREEEGGGGKKKKEIEKIGEKNRKEQKREKSRGQRKEEKENVPEPERAPARFQI